MTFSPKHFDFLTPSTQNSQILLYKTLQILLFLLKHTVAVVTHAHVLQIFYTTWVRGVNCQKQRLGPKLEGAALGKHVESWDPQFISATVEANNIKFGIQLGLGE